MGYNTVLFICNDAMGEIDKDPKGWWEKTSGLIARSYEPATYGFGNHCNGFMVVASDHADVTNVIATGGNFAEVLFKEGFTHRYNTESREKLLRRMAASLGYTLAKRPKREP